MFFELEIKERKVVLPRPCVMGVINLSKSSFFDPSPHFSQALDKAARMIAEGAKILDVGFVATNPFVQSIETPSAEVECELVLPFVEALAKRFDILISVDTSEPIVMQEAVARGAHMVNDQTALRNEKALKLVSQLQIPVCLMHAFYPPRQPNSSSCAELLFTVKKELQQSIDRCLQAGIARNRIMIDPGFGGGYFGKSADENFYLLSKIKEIVDLSFPVLVGLSRKSMFGDLLNLMIEERLTASITGATIAAMRGAAIVRVHDVKETIEAMTVIRKIMEMESIHG